MKKLDLFVNRKWKKPSKGMIYIIVLLWIAAGTQLLVNQWFISDKRVMEAFSNTDSSSEESKLEIAADCGNRFLISEDKKQLLQYIASEIGLEEPYTMESKKGEKANSLTIYKKAKNAETAIEIVSNESKQYIIVRLTLYEEGNNILKYKEILEDVMEELKAEENQSLITFTGTYEGELTEREKEKEINGILDRLQAKVVSRSDEGETHSVYAYTGLVKEHIKISNQPININIVMTYDQIRNKTKLYLATPILNEDY